MPRTLFEKLWDEHIVAASAGQLPLLYVDLHLVHEVTSPQAFDGLRAAGRKVREPLRTIATVDHNIPTEPRGTPITDEIAKRQIEAHVAYASLVLAGSDRKELARQLHAQVCELAECYGGKKLGVADGSTPLKQTM